jgi:transcriptional regulator with XRE-family HTH domain
MKIGEKIYSLRKKYNLSQEDLANELNVSRQTVSKWEVGESCPDFDKIVPLCELFGISTEELLRDKKIEEKEENTTPEKKVDITKAVLICISLFLYFLAIISTIVQDQVAHLNDGIIAASFLFLCGLGTILLVFTFLTRKSNIDKKIEQIKAKKENKLQNSVISIVGLLATIIYLLVGFLTMAWHITWIIWLVYAVVVEIIKLVFSLKGKDENEE